METSVSVQDIAPNNAQEDPHGEDILNLNRSDERETTNDLADNNTENQDVRRSSRVHRVPEKYKDFVTELSPNDH